MGSILDKVSYEQLKEAVETSYNLSDAMIKIGYVKPRANNYKSFKKLCSDWQIDFSHLIENTNNPLANVRYTDEEVFCLNSKISQSSLRNRYLKLNIEYKCSLCGISEWQDKPLTLRLDHINGNKTDNRLENLRWICPNCDSQLDTYCNNGSIKNKHSYCIDCGAVITYGANRCEDCAKKALRKVARPERNELKNLIRNFSFIDIGKQFDVNDNTIRKWCDYYNLPRRKTDIKSYSDEEWILI